MNKIKSKIKRMRALTFENSFRPSQTENQQYLPIAQENLEKFEEKHQIRIPEQYREFLLSVGNGGLGPGNGMFPLETERQYGTKLHLPWINPTTYNKTFKYDSAEDDEEAFDQRMNSIFDDSESPELEMYHARENGILSISDGGCGTSIFLVVSGVKRGQIWIDLNVTEEGYALVADNFYSWYEGWLNKKVEDLEAKYKEVKKNMVIYEQSPPEFESIRDVHDFMGQFIGVKEMGLVNDVLTSSLQNDKHLSVDVMKTIVDYLINHQQFMNYALSLEFIEKVMKGNEDMDSSTLKHLFCQKGQAYAGLQKYGKAIYCFKKALNLDMFHFPKGSLQDEHLQQYGFCLLKLNKKKEAVSLMFNFRSDGSIGNAVSLLIDLFEKHKAFQLAIVWGEMLLNLSSLHEYPNSQLYISKIYLYLTYATIRLKDESQMEKYLDELSAMEGTLHDIPYGQIALLLFEEGFFSKSLHYLDIHEVSPNSKNNLHWIYNLKGCCHSDSGNHQKGIEYFQKSFDIERWIVPYCNLIRPYIHLKEFDKAQKVFHDVLDFDPYYSWNHYQFSLYHIEKDDPQMAIASLKKAIALGFDVNEIKKDMELKTIVEHL